MAEVPDMDYEIIDLLPDHLEESGRVTWEEMNTTQNWAELLTDSKEEYIENWLKTGPPFSFLYSGKESGEILKNFNLQIGKKYDNKNVTYQDFVWLDVDTGLQITMKTKMFKGYPAVDWVIEIENTGSTDTPLIEGFNALDIKQKSSGKTLSYGVFNRENVPYKIHGVTGGRSFADDMIPFTWELPSREIGNSVTLGGDHPSSNRHMPFFNIESPENRGMIVGVGWSGNWIANLSVEDHELTTEVGLKGNRFILHPEEKIRTARILLLFWKGKRLHGQNMFRHLLHKHYVPQLNDEPQKPLVSVNVCFTHHGRGGFLHQATEKEVLSIVQPFIEIGSELFIIDAGWYDGAPWQNWLGNWKYSKEKYPRGFKPISEPLEKGNVAFGLWFASENVSGNAPIMKEHPEWVRNGTLRMDIPEAREWFLKQVEYMIRNEGMDCFRQDGSGEYGEDSEDRKGINESKHIQGLYKLWDTLLERHPDLIMEGCSGGGRRIDLETLSRFHWHQKSDRWYDSESDQCSLYGANLFLPGSVINIPTERTDDYGAWSSFAGQFSLGWHPLDDDFPMDKAKKQVELYKQIRHLLIGDFYPLTPCSMNQTWIGYQFHRNDLNTGLVLIYRRPAAEDAVYPVGDSFKAYLRGVDPGVKYRVTLERSGKSGEYTGSELNSGLEITIAETEGVELIRYEPAD
ncbi:hypothetical protein GF312_03185 [Candidatus Poribacteria bacterium]|nr:hypothetical protein [Candidatus Poribacteria bacterium]